MTPPYLPNAARGRNESWSPGFNLSEQHKGRTPTCTHGKLAADQESSSICRTRPHETAMELSNVSIVRTSGA
jgi:hypothetical protein